MTLVPKKSLKKNKNGTVTVYTYPNRRRVQRTFATRRLAEDYWINFHLQRQKERVYGERRDNHVLIQDVFKMYRKGVIKSPRSIIRDDWILKRFNDWMGLKKIYYVDQLKKDKVKEYEQHRLNQGVKQRTVNIDLDFLNAALNYAWKMDRIAFNPMGRYPFAPDGHHFEKVPTIKELNAILDSSAASGYYNAFYTALTLGLRAEEICYLQFGDIQGNKVQLKEKTIWEIVKDKKVKRTWAPKWYRQRGGRWIYLDKNYVKDTYLQKILKDGAGSAYCFPDPDYTDGRPLNGNKLYKTFKKIVKKATVKDDSNRDVPIHDHEKINVHTLRHAHVSYMVARAGKDPNVSIPIIMENVGINDFETMRRYTQAVKDLADNLPDPTRFPWQKD